MTRSRLTAVVIAAIVLAGELRAQNFEIGTSTIHDGNIFDIYTPTPDQVTQLAANAYGDWDADPFTFSLAYSGSFLLFNDVTARNYHVHIATFDILCELPGGDDDEADPAEDDSTGNGGEHSQGPHLPEIIPHPGGDTVGTADSVHGIAHFTLLGGGQFDKPEYSQFDNAKIGGTVTYRLPVGPRLGLWPSYMLAYHSYANLDGLTNVEQAGGLAAGMRTIPGGWAGIGGTFGAKHYPVSTVYSYTVGRPGNAGHGKGGAGGGVGSVRTRTFALNTPSVSQWTASLQAVQRIGVTELRAGYDRLGTPSTEARIIPLQVEGQIEGEFASNGFQNDIFDDHYAYAADVISIELRQPLPLEAKLTARGAWLKKRYTAAAMDLNDSLALAPQRLDTRWEGEIGIARPIPLGGGRTLEPRIVVDLLRNESNAPYYDFGKSAFTAGIDFSF